MCQYVDGYEGLQGARGFCYGSGFYHLLVRSANGFLLFLANITNPLFEADRDGLSGHVGRSLTFYSCGQSRLPIHRTR